ncbi:hypothetical protein T484DRAFT_3625945 [Baffinella frigidus]|nr:hypothetical protein T484DRAFT_3625945 [Cryptophyta sp. CCMP2293]
MSPDKPGGSPTFDQHSISINQSINQSAFAVHAVPTIPQFLYQHSRTTRPINNTTTSRSAPRVTYASTHRHQHPITQSAFAVCPAPPWQCAPRHLGSVPRATFAVCPAPPWQCAPRHLRSVPRATLAVCPAPPS